MSVSRLQERLLTAVARNGASGCWEWRGQVSNTGYGRIKYRDECGDVRMQSAHQVSYEAFLGPIPQGMLVRQTCNNRLCINPEHLEIFDPESRNRA